ncbi:hypothetical protein GJ744_005613 [Endocarpon pusillum]|uniref:Uncharacterized protein n=1 Tax=Endocarpon pusillum TaxID=364733 RepID=A0A8H7AC60_9EURO|nr:hypothetical protein GJ744_005613 [Endocarpon pusillum]
MTLLSMTWSLIYRPESTGDLIEVPYKITEVNDQGMRRCWRACYGSIPIFILLPEKIQRVTKGESQCLYESFKWTVGEKLSAMRKAMAGGLKKSVEELELRATCNYQSAVSYPTSRLRENA